MSGKSTDFTNRTFGELKVVKRAENSNSGHQGGCANVDVARRASLMGDSSRMVP